VHYFNLSGKNNNYYLCSVKEKGPNNQTVPFIVMAEEHPP
jgi:hypothetical protein